MIDFTNSATFPGSLGRWSQQRHIVEGKAGWTRTRIEGNLFSGQAADLAAPQGYAIWVNQLPSAVGTELFARKAVCRSHRSLPL